jgi:hypothetical protein
MGAIGGYTGSVNSYSLAAAEVIVPHVLGFDFDTVQDESTSLAVIAEKTDLLVCFGGLPLKNARCSMEGKGATLSGAGCRGAEPEAATSSTCLLSRTTSHLSLLLIGYPSGPTPTLLS